MPAWVSSICNFAALHGLGPKRTLRQLQALEVWMIVVSSAASRLTDGVKDVTWRPPVALVLA